MNNISEFRQHLKELGLTPQEYLEAMEALKEIMEKDVIYTGGFRMYGGATVAECYCSKCGGTFWVNYTCPRPYCEDCEPTAPSRSYGLGRPNEGVEESERRYHGEKVEI